MAKHMTADALRVILSGLPTATELVKARYWIYRHRKELANDPNFQLVDELVAKHWPRSRRTAKSLTGLAKIAADTPLGLEDDTPEEEESDSF